MIVSGDQILNIANGAMAMTGRNNVDSVVEMMLSSKIGDFCDIGNRMDPFMKRLMELNNKELSITLNALGFNALIGGDSSSYSSVQRQSPSYAEERNYVDTFASQISSSEKNGNDSTRVSLTTNYASVNYGENGDLYERKTNLYYDENSTGEFTNRIVNSKQKSIINKTKKLFNLKKINTIISRFHTENAPASIGDNGSAYGLSHGRNLLTKAAEQSGGKGGYDTNGYNNPYCRVWTHHHQYDEYTKVIRPFVTNDGDSEKPLSVQDFHNLPQFKSDADTNEEKGWKEDNPGWVHSVLASNGTGMVNITPKFKSAKVHTKDCMFAIENLAWKGYDPYSFEKALSWEQRGPNGGRIMWFPPYGIRFNENVTAKWNANTFIGRGEDVFTYVNTTRQGTLNFMMLVDHPSIVDYVGWQENNGGVSDADMLRFFAGCDDGTVRNAAKPTPLTDEFKENPVIDETSNVIEFIPQSQVPDVEPIAVTFYVFYPNNYSGYYDQTGSTVESMAYLLAGKGSQKKANADSNSKLTTDIPLSFDSLAESDGTGYEMGTGDGISVTDDSKGNYIVGTSPNWQYMKTRSKYIPSSPMKKWYYRTDGKYENAPKSQWDINTYDQTLAKTNNYQDRSNYNFNCDISQVRKHFTDEQSNEYLYSFAEVAYAITSRETIQDKIKGNAAGFIDKDDERMKKLIEMLQDTTGTYKITSITAKGFSNSHGATVKHDSNKELTTGERRNRNLAINRAKSVVDWIKSVEGGKYKEVDVEAVEDDDYIAEVSAQVAVKDKSDVSGETSKKYRSAKIILHISKSAQKSLSNTPQEVIVDGQPVQNEFVRFIGFSPAGQTTKDGKELYRKYLSFRKDDYNKLWYYDEDRKLMVVYNPETYGKGPEIVARYGDGENDGKDVNKLRYDQEYHFFKVLENKSPLVFKQLMEKVKYFDPAFHSMTPEGFNARLNFLQQCTRQGNTLGADSVNSKSANNLAFGMQPYCILRLGDFYNHLIVIENISFDYDPLVWDLNTEGIGVQPLICNVSISFKFIGGGDMGGAVRRLQNAMSFSYYANTSLYDNRADRVSQKWEDDTCGALTQGEINSDASTWYDTKMRK